MEGYVDFDVPSDALASLEMVLLGLSLLGENDAWWKWVVVGAHMAAYTSMVGSPGLRAAMQLK